jgi:type IV pilus assembly protein PilA
MRIIKSNLAGFTIIELLIVVIIIGILAALAIPQFRKSAESSTAAEAYNNLNAIRRAEWAYYTKTGNIGAPAGGTTNLGFLNIENPNNMSNKSFEYSLSLNTVNPPFTVRARRTSGPYRDQYILMDANGNINESGWLQ